MHSLCAPYAHSKCIATSSFTSAHQTLNNNDAGQLHAAAHHKPVAWGTNKPPPCIPSPWTPHTALCIVWQSSRDGGITSIRGMNVCVCPCITIGTLTTCVVVHCAQVGNTADSPSALQSPSVVSPRGDGATAATATAAAAASLASLSLRAPPPGDMTSSPNRMCAQLVIPLRTAKGGKVGVFHRLGGDHTGDHTCTHVCECCTCHVELTRQQSSHAYFRIRHVFTHGGSYVPYPCRQVDDAVRVVRWGGGAHQLLAAAVGYSVYILSLDAFFEAIFTGSVVSVVVIRSCITTMTHSHYTNTSHCPAIVPSHPPPLAQVAQQQLQHPPTPPLPTPTHPWDPPRDVCMSKWPSHNTGQRW